MRCVAYGAVLLAVVMAFAVPGQAADCGPDKLGTSRTIMLKKGAGGAWGGQQHAPLAGLAPGEVVLTFDDGPVPQLTPQVLDALKSECAQATFFMTGSHLDTSPAIARRVVAEGHSVGIHSYAHPNLTALSDSAQLDDLAQAQAAYQRVFGHPAPAYRFPFLAETPTMLAALAKDGIAVFSIDLGIADWQPADTTPVLVERLAKELEGKPGGIILMHDANGPTAAALPSLLRTLKEKGFKLVHVDWQG